MTADMQAIKEALRELIPELAKAVADELTRRDSIKLDAAWDAAKPLDQLKAERRRQMLEENRRKKQKK